MIGVDRLVRVLRIVAATASVENAGPISIVLVAPSDGGKSQLIAKTAPPNARVINDFTFASMVQLLSEKTPPTWIVVPDFNAVISHKPAVASLAMGLLLSLLAEGITEIPGVDKEAKLKAKSFKKRGLRIALITGMTPDMFHSKRGKWRETGLLRRLTPIQYTYSDETIEEIQTLIREGSDALDYSLEKSKKLKRRAIKIPAAIAREVEALARFVIETQLVWKYHTVSGEERFKKGHEFPFSVHKIFRNYIKASALTRGKGVCERKDFLALKDFSRFVRYDRAEEL